MLTSLVYLQKGDVKKSKKLMKLAKIDEENLHISQTTWGTLLKFSGKMCIIILLKVTKKQSFRKYCRKYSFEKTTVKGGGQIHLPAFLRLRKRYITDAWQGSKYSSGSEYDRVLNIPGLNKVLNKTLHYRYLIGFWMCL